MSPKRFSQYIANLCPAPARHALVVLGFFVVLAAFAGLLLLLSPGPATAVAAPVEKLQTAVSSPAPMALAVTMAASDTTTTILQHTPDPSRVGDPVWVEFQVVPNTNTGESVDGTITVSATLDTTDVVTCSRTVDSSTPGWPYAGGWRWNCNLYPTDAGIWLLTAYFEPGNPAHFNPSTSGGVLHQVKPAIDVDIDVFYQPDSPVYGQEITFTAKITPSVCSGIVFFDDGGTEIGRATLDSSGTATVEALTLGAGPHRVKAVYLGSDACPEAESDPRDLTVAKANTEIDPFLSSNNNSVFGEYVVFTATVAISETVSTPGATTPTGLVTFWSDDGTYVLPMGQGTLNGEGQAWFGTSGLAVDSYTIKAVYEGDANYKPSEKTLSQTVNKANTEVTVTGPGSSYYGKSVTFEAKVSVVAPGAGTPTGKVTFSGWGDSFEASLFEGKATFTTMEPKDVGHVTITAEYKGDDNFNGDSGTKGHTVNKAKTTTELQDPLDETDYGQDARFIVSVKRDENEPGSGTPTGTVTLFMNPGPPANDYMYTSGTLTFNPGDTTKTVSVPVIGDTDGEPHETYFVNLSNATNADFVDGQGVGTITDDDGGTGEPNLSIDNVTVVEGDTGTKDAVFTVSLSSASGDTVTVDYATADNTAIEPSDYVTTSGTLTFSPWDTTETIAVTVNGDFGLEPHETYFVNLSSPTNATIANGQGVGTITNDDGGTYDPNVLIDNVTVVEGDDGTVDAVFTVSLSSVSGDTVTVDYETADDTATAVFIEEDLPDTGSVVTIITNTLRPGEHDVWAEYGGDKNFKVSTSDTVTHTVNKADSETTLESSANPSDFGQTVTFTATVEAAGLGLFAPISPTGTVTFTFGTVGVMTDTLDASGVASVTTTLPAGTHDTTAEYGGDDNFEPSDDTLRQTVNVVATTTELSGPSSSAVGDSVTFTATVSETLSGDPVTDGDVTFYDGVKELATVALNGSGQATYNTSSFTAGLHPIKAIYNGTANFQASTSGRLNHTVSAAGSTTTLTMPPSSVYGQNVTFTATVTAGGAPVTSGQVTFYDGAAELGSDTLDTSGEANISTSTLAAGAHTIKARFEGNADYGPSEDTETYTVDKANTTTSITSDDPDSSVVGQPVLVEFTVEAVSPGSGNPTGNVTISDGTGATCVGSVGSAGSCTLIPTTTGNKTLEATYAGDTNFNGSSDNTQTHQVNPADTTTTVTSSPNPSLLGGSVAINATVTANPPGSGTPTGDVTFKDGSTPICSNVPLSGGSATCNTTALALGSHTLWADYLGDGNFNTSSDSTIHNVGDNPTDLSVTKTDSPDPVNVGEDVTYIIAVTNHGPLGTDVTLNDTLPPQATFVSSTPNQGSCPTTPSVGDPGGNVTCNLGTMANGGSATVTIVVNVPTDTPAGTVLENTAQVSGTRPEPVPDPHSNTATAETTVYRSPRRGDCNGDDAVDPADIWAIVRDIFDPTYVGTTGCDANQDRQVDAGDVPSTVLIMFRGLNAGGRGGDLNTATEGPALTMPDQVPAVPGGLVTLPVSFAANGHSITSLAFSVDYDETWLTLDPVDRDGNGVPDAVVFSLPGDFTYSVTFDEGDSDGEVDVFIGDISPPLTSLSDGPVVYLILDVDTPPASTQGAVLFSLDPAASFGDTSGQSVPGTATPTARQHQIYLPVAFR